MDEALRCGHRVSTLTRGTKSETTPGVESLIGDFRQPRGQGLLKDRSFDAVVHFIAYDSSDVARDPEFWKGRVGHYVFISSASVYAKPPTPYITEKDRVGNPYWEYAQKKLSCEAALLRAHHEESFPITVVRPSHTYGHILPSMVGGGGFTVVARLLQKRPVVLADRGDTPWTLTHHGDFSRALIGLLGKSETHGQVYHITSDECPTWNEIYFALARVSGGSFHPVYLPAESIAFREPDLAGGLLGDKRWPLRFDNSKIKALLPWWACQTPLKNGLEQTLAWFHENPARLQIDVAMDKRLARLAGG